ncbi:EamA family transporter [Pseudodesulfovibrio sp. F-1]|uniref:EamA family transporter n=1 Tax=Pseudodesulfovibrio alkaliphilus TaxID=2661613 RepID=A0A7K1KMD2_9BACT|nr:DMT family transporter [Pseudodesulfovibrio alkaliphilus]MUM77254.1 EamA family transporter [Pseudodesulfovibrio alkaliphilus]
MKEHSLTSVYTLLILSMALWGGTWVAGRVLAQSIHPMSAAFLRFVLASAMLAVMCRRAEGHMPRLERGQILPAIFLGATGVFIYSYFFFTGLQTIPAGRAALIVACIPVCISLLSALLYKERFGPVRMAGALLSLVGVSVVIADGNPLALLSGGVNRGDFMILGCVASWTAYSLGGRSAMKRLSPLTAVTWSCFFGTLMLLGPAVAGGLAEDVVRARAIDWACLVFLGVLATGLAYFWYYRAISVIGASRAGIFINTVPVFAVIMGALILREPIHLSLLLGGTMVVSGVYLTNRH